MQSKIEKEEIKGEKEESTSDNKEFRVTLYGKTGAGKSTLCNLILGSEEFKVGHSIESCTEISESRMVFWQNVLPVKLTDTPGFSDNRKNSRANQIAQTVKETSLGLNIALYLISINGTRFDNADTRALQCIVNLLTKAGVPHIYLVFTQGDENPVEEVKNKIIEKWIKPSFAILNRNDVVLDEKNFYILRSGKDDEFVDWLMNEV
jgi:predicted GTPase